MNLRRILCPVDFSPCSEAANYYASTLAASTGASVAYLHVAYPSILDGSIESELDSMLEELSSRIQPTAKGVRCFHNVRYGNPAKQISELAKELDVDLIVMGTHGQTAAPRALHGSVLAKVLRGTECAVMAVKTRNLKFEQQPTQNDQMAR